MNDDITRRIARELGLPDLSGILSERLSGADLHSLLLGVLKRRVEAIPFSKLSEANSAIRATDLDGRLLHKVEQIQFETASEFEVIEVSPVVPLGTVRLLTGLDQANVLSTIRAFECASDPTIGMALECARRRKNPSNRRGRAGKTESTRLCTSQRVLRFPIPQKAGFTAHFKLFCLVTAGRDTGSFSFETATLREHIDFYLTFLSRLPESDLGFSFKDISVEVSDTRVVSHLCSTAAVDRDEVRSSVRARDHDSARKILEKYAVSWPATFDDDPAAELAAFDVPPHMIAWLKLLKDQICGRLKAKHASVDFAFNLHRLTGLGYYDGPCFHIKLKNAAGESFMLADGGLVNWTQRLLGDSKERLMTSAIGTELLCRMFR